MDHIKWDKKFQIGVSKIDEQHHRLFDLTRELIEATSEGKGRRIIVDVLKSLILYTKTHFVDEEAIMIKVNYPEYAIHKLEHEKFIQEVGIATKDLLEGHSVPTLKVAEFLGNWLIDHVLIHDKRIGDYIQAGKFKIDK
ncbi:MAG: hemerythrin family protein [Leptospira sp.]|nr:hemerythrin family protein [Leptospira sp.]